jgi:hypothetical protein
MRKASGARKAILRLPTDHRRIYCSPEHPCGIPIYPNFSLYHRIETPAIAISFYRTNYHRKGNGDVALL